MGNAIIARKLVRDILEANVLDPYPGTRKGVSPKHFIDKSEGLNLSRGETFPKGFITDDTPISNLTQIGNSGNSENSASVNVWYFVKEKINYTDGDSVTYYSEDYVSYMTKQIRDTLLANLTLGSDYHIKSFGDSDGPKNTKEGSFKVFFDVVPITIYWNEVY